MSQTFLRIVEVLLGMVHLAEVAPLCTGTAAICHLPLTLPTASPNDSFFFFFSSHLHFSSVARNPYVFEQFQASLLDRPARRNEKEKTAGHLELVTGGE